ncbi:MAG: hypothetical protein ABSA13_15410 [Beijerinckiaceae bacterium]
MSGFVGDEKAGVVHAERRQNACCQNSRQRPARGNFDHPAENFGGMAIFPHAPRLVSEGKRRKPVGEFLVGHIGGKQPGLAIEIPHRAAIGLIGQAGGMAQQILDCGLIRRLRQNAIPENLGVGEGRNEIADGLAEMEPPLRRQHHRGNGHDRLGHGINPENRYPPS